MYTTNYVFIKTYTDTNLLNIKQTRVNTNKSVLYIERWQYVHMVEVKNMCFKQRLIFDKDSFFYDNMNTYN